MEEKKDTIEKLVEFINKLKRFEKICNDILAILKMLDDEKTKNQSQDVKNEADRIEDVINAFKKYMDIVNKKEEKDEEVIRDSE